MKKTAVVITGLVALSWPLSGCGSSESTSASAESSVSVSPAPLASVDSGVCVDIKSSPKKGWEDKGYSYAKLLVKPNFRITNNCEKKIKSIKFTWTLNDEFGDPLSHGYSYTDAVRLNPGASSIRSDWRYEHYDTDDNYNALDRMTNSEIVPVIEDIDIVFMDGTKLSDSTAKISD